MRRSNGTLILLSPLLLAGVLALQLAGCSSENGATAPAQDDALAVDNDLVVDEALLNLGAVIYDLGETLEDALEDPLTPDGALVELIPFSGRAGQTSKLVRASKGGVVSYGRFTVYIPASALEEDTVITVRDPGAAALVCQLEPHGLQFNKPVVLQMGLLGLDYDQNADGWTIFYLNEETGRWEDTGGSKFWTCLGTFLDHFSTYGGGRAGW